MHPLLLSELVCLPHLAAHPDCPIAPWSLRSLSAFRG